MQLYLKTVNPIFGSKTKVENNITLVEDRKIIPEEEELVLNIQ